MPRYDSSYDYGLRGARETSAPHFSSGSRPSRRPYASYYDERSQPRIENRVVQRYNSDYVYGARGPRYDRNFQVYTGDRPDRIGDERMFRQPYNTIGGTRTSRGASFRTGYDRPDYGRAYDDRYPGER